MGRFATPSDDVCINTTKQHKNDVNKNNSVSFCFFSKTIPPTFIQYTVFYRNTQDILSVLLSNIKNHHKQF